MSEDHDLDSDEALFQRARALQRARRWRDAVPLVRRLLDRFPDHPALLAELGTVSLRAGDVREAVALFERSLQRAPGHAQTHFALGVGLSLLGRRDEALAQLERAAALRPEHVASHYQRGVVLLAQGRHAQALEAIDRALALDPDHPHALHDRGAALKALGRFDEALECLERAVALAPAFAGAHYGLGALLRDGGRFDEARASLERAIELEPEIAGVRSTLGMLHLAEGNFADGWRLYEWRWQDPSMRGKRREFGVPRWSASDPAAGGTVLIHAEQGLGDTLQFCRYVPMVAALGARVLFEVPAPLATIVRSLPCEVEVVVRGQALPAFDRHCPLMSLPLEFGTRVDSIPSRLPYLRARPDDVHAWARRLGPATSPRIGLAWSGNTQHPVGRRRSVPLAQLVPLLRLPFEFHSLQRETLPDDAPVLAALGTLRRHETALADFAQTAALVELMDRVICIDTSVAHLAGALGRAPWILLPRVADWRWLRDREDSPWYPGATLFRQAADGDWSDVVARLADRLSPGRPGDARQ